MPEDPALIAHVDQESAALRNLLDEHPVFAYEMRHASPWSDGARLAIIDCLVYRSDPQRMLARMWAWVHMLEEEGG